MIVFVLALIDGLVGAYLVQYAVARERRDKAAVLVTGIFLLACAAALLVIGLLPPLGPKTARWSAHRG